eukprot:Hpha_TRINITY_DN13951_c0_g1::TRINITY_DN13951_c0_g1_i1::g.35686::m.35686/K01968/E6.4.1.4A; 3-methylcrotonyl-CoA carboxylase alpha subunit
MRTALRSGRSVVGRRNAAAAAVAKVPIDKILIANRGEITCRIVETARLMGIRTVAVHCDAESDGKHVQMADEAFRLGPPPAQTSYLLADKILEAARTSGAQAIHPGYGFLSENATFADDCASAGIEFIGPPASAIRSMGSKSESKLIMEGAGVPCVPGYHDVEQSNEKLQAEADGMGYPLLIKAVLGGGGKGMRVVRSSKEFINELEGARREAVAFFKDDRVLLERYIEEPRHVEVQVFADKHGNAVYLFERDCSVQRRHQKVLEEAPAPGLSEELRKKMGETAVRAAKAVGYVGAGTVEFIFDTADDKYYFMEMNTRLQVEHPVTEMVTGLDLVRLQILVAQGHPLPFSQEDLELKGHAIEARIYAEDPEGGFLPGSGTLRRVILPNEGAEGETVRVDSGFREGDDVLVHYDPMIAKLIVHAKDRPSALLGLKRALEQYHIVGVPTNIAFLIRSVVHPDFAAGGVTTKFIEQNQDALLVRAPPCSTRLVSAAVSVLARNRSAVQGSAPAPFATQGPFRLNHGKVEKLSFMNGEDEIKVEAVSKGEHEWEVRGDGWSHQITVTSWPAFDKQGRSDGAVVISCDGKRMQFEAVVPGDEPTVSVLSPKDGTFTLKRRSVPAAFGDISALAAGSRMTAPMPGKIIKVSKSEGDEVEIGDEVVVLEAMKMEHKVLAPAKGTLEGLSVKPGEMVKGGQLLANVATGEEEEE